MRPGAFLACVVSMMNAYRSMAMQTCGHITQTCLIICLWQQSSKDRSDVCFASYPQFSDDCKYLLFTQHDTYTVIIKLPSLRLMAQWSSG